MDGRLRDSERMAAQGDPAARSLLLRRRVRAGELDPADVELAGYLGDAAAAAATDVWPSEAPFGEWLLGLARFGKPVLVRAALALGKALADDRRLLPGVPGEGTLAALSAAEAWCDGASRTGWKRLEAARQAALLSDEGPDRALAWLAVETLNIVDAPTLAAAEEHLREVASLAQRVLPAERAQAFVADALTPST